MFVFLFVFFFGLFCCYFCHFPIHRSSSSLPLRSITAPFINQRPTAINFNQSTACCCCCCSIVEVVPFFCSDSISIGFLLDSRRPRDWIRFRSNSSIKMNIQRKQSTAVSSTLIVFFSLPMVQFFFTAINKKPKPSIDWREMWFDRFPFKKIERKTMKKRSFFFSFFFPKSCVVPKRFRRRSFRPITRNGNGDAVGDEFQ